MLDTRQKSKLNTKAVVKATAITASALFLPGGIPLLVGYYLARRCSERSSV